MAQEQIFAGKFTFATPQGLKFTLGADGMVSLAASVADDPMQRFNTYGDVENWMQGSNGLYLVYDKALLTYTASATRDGAPGVFRIENSGSDIRIVELTSDTKEYYLSANGSALERLPLVGAPPDSTLFSREKITVGLDQIKPGSMANEFDLSYAFLANADLSGVRFYSANLNFANIQGANIIGAIFSSASCRSLDASECVFENVTFSNVDASNCILSNAKFAPNSTFSGTVLDGATLTGLYCNALVSLNGISAKKANFDGADLRHVAMNNAKLEKASFVGVDFRDAQVSSTDFQHAILNRCNFSQARVQSSNFNSAILVGIDFAESEVTGSTFVKADLTNAALEHATSLYNVDFSGAQLIGAQLNDVDFVAQEIKVDKDTNFTQTAMDGVNLTGYNLDGCVFLFASLRGALLDKVSFKETTLTQADLSYSSITGNVLFYGANLSNAKLEGAHLNGGQFGPLTSLGSLSTKELTSLNDGSYDCFSKAFNIDAKSMQVEARAGNRSWSIKAGSRCFLAYSEADAINLHEVSSELQGAVFSNAYMPNAILKEANLYAVDMTGVQWYGGSADASGANMELVNLTNSNIATMDFTQAKLYGANFSFANMIQTNFFKAELTATSGMKPVSMAFSSLQGANFEEASIYDANLTNAAVSLKIDDSEVTLNGDPVFKLDPSFGQYLDTGFLTDALVALFLEQKITVSKEDTLTVLSLGSVWALAPCATNDFGQYILVLPKGEEMISVLGQSADGAFTTTAPDILAVPLANMPKDIAPDLNAGKVTAKITKAFADLGYPLIETAGFVVLKDSKRWVFRNMYLDNTVIQSGYGQFEILKSSGPQGEEIKLFGAAPLMVMRVSAGNTIERVPVQFGQTSLSPVNMNKTTTTPSGLKFGLLSEQLTYQYLMSPGLPPAPPACVPSPTSWCP